MKCTVCRGPAVIDLRRHNAHFCAEHLERFCRDQVRKAVEHHEMFDVGDRILVAVSGGKDSLAVWDILTELGVAADGFYVGLGIGDYSDASAGFARRFADERSLRLWEYDLSVTHGFDIPTGSRAAGRVPCSACGTSKRHLFDDAARRGGYSALATGHNLDDEAAVLFGNVLHWNVEYLARQRPVLPERKGFPRKIKPLVRLTERETAAYCVVRGIDYQVDECPMAAGNKHLAYKHALNSIEAESPGAKAAFYHEFLRRAVDRFDDKSSRVLGPSDATAAGPVDEVGPELVECDRCGSPCSGQVCAFCRLLERAGARPAQPVVLRSRAHDDPSEVSA